MQIIEHQIYGKGKIQKKRFGGFELYVEFEDGIKRWVRRDEVRFLSETPILIKHKPSGLTLSEEQYEARQIIEALKLGVVPHKYVEEFTFGRKEEIKQIKNWLNNSNSGTLAIIGEYGVGKTHLLEYIYSFALNNNWAVSIVGLDPNEAPLHKPKIIYQKIISSFKFKGQNGDFREFLKKIALSTRYELKDHKYIGRIVEEIRNGTDDEHVWEWIEGNPTWYFYPPLYEYSTCANVYCYILSGIGWVARNILGLNGLLILFDEVESVDPYWYTSYQNNKAWNFLTGMVLMANNDERLLSDIVEPRYTWSGYPQGWWGKITGLQYCGYSHLPFIWKIPCYVKIILTFTSTSIPWILYREPLNNLNKFELECLDNESLMKISNAILNLYQKAYNFKPNRDQVAKAFNLIPKDKTRLFIKGMIETLDLMRFHSDKSVEELVE